MLRPLASALPRRAWGLRRLGGACQPTAGASPSQHRRRLRNIVADGWTPYSGTVLQVTRKIALVDIGCDRPGLLPLRGHFVEDPVALASLRQGKHVTVYVTQNKISGGEHKVCLSLGRRALPRQRWAGIVADGKTPYEGTVSNVVEYGAFIDIGCEVQGLLTVPRVTREELNKLCIGDPVVVYIWSKHPEHRRLNLSTLPRERPLLRLDEIRVDGRTPYEGTVLQVEENAGAFMDIGTEVPVLVPFRDLELDAEGRPLTRVGEQLTVYAVQRHRGKGHLTMALQPSPVPLRSLSELVVDGQTPYSGTILSTTSFGSFVDIGFEVKPLLPAHEGMPEPGTPVVVYANNIEAVAGRVTVSLCQSPRPLESFSDVVADGFTPYRATVRRFDCGGFFMDMGFERCGFLPQHDVVDRELNVGDEVTVYVVERSMARMRLWLSLQPLEKPLLPLSMLEVDGQTPYEGRVRRVTDVGAYIDIGFERTALLPRDSETGFIDGDPAGTVVEGEDVVVYVQRKNELTGKLCVTMEPSPKPRLRADEVAPGACFMGRVYRVQYGDALVDFGCELGGVLPLEEAPSSAKGDEIAVKVLVLNPTTYRFGLTVHTDTREAVVESAN